jgi:2-keto-4-pentenoate hydratase/2-oxohepta-3-ene-1,7-dioic acid hydratase in catechol pathway
MERRPSWTRLIRFIAREDGAQHYGQPVDDTVDVGLALHQGRTIHATVIRASSAIDPNARLTSQVLTVSKLLSPIERSSIGAVLAIGLNYIDHAKEMGFDIPDVPTTFLKARTAITDPNSVITVPKAALDHIDYEIELAAVISKDCRDVSPENALDYILGYTLANDLTSRRHQSLTTQWSHSKSFDAFCPIGPCIVSSSLIPDPTNIALTTRLASDPERLLQVGNTHSWIFTLAKAISYMSQGCTLEAGTVVLTGTPPGIGAGHVPPVWLRHGDVTLLNADHGIGTLVNSFSFESAQKMTNGFH